MSKSFNLAVIGGDGIGPEVVAEGLKVLDEVSAKYGVTFNKKEYELGARLWHKTGETLPDATLTELAKADVILLGAVGDPTVPNGVLERGLLLKLRFAFDHFINLRPARLYPGVKSPLVGVSELDFIVVREGTEGPYVGAGGVLAEGTADEIATEESLNTRRGAERVIRNAFARAQARPRKKLTLVHKNNVLTRAGSLWTRTFNEVAKEFPDVATDYLHVDAASMFFVTNPDRFDVVVTDNLFGDILTDIAAAICGGIGLAASGNINPTGKFPSMFEPVHGSAPDIAGKAIADPTATIMSVAMMLSHLGLFDAAKDVEKAVAADLLTRGDKKRSTTEIGTLLANAVKG
ncbi:MAG: 3-isopropylmalate dehydrogenase [Actinobacteria bacterium]|jgi:3-isopropylmalate dehydrogenase|nr:3-isopropylmalate dehydrogenase [Actinomycetota bacterium]NDH12645.1 3-isopropylmalate dehydrogenase [Actinomycetota bacterium]